MSRFTDRSVVVTGAASGIGAAIAAGLAREGADVLWVDRAADVEEVAARHQGKALVGDVTDPALPQQVLKTAGSRGIDHLVGAAGVQVRIDAADIADDDWNQLLAVNLSALYRLIRQLLPALKVGTHGKPGSVLAVTSMSADRAVPGIVPYGSVKAAVSHLIRGLAVELGPTGVRLNGIAPGYVATPMTASVLEDPERVTTIMGRLPLKRIGEPQDMAGPSLFLLSDEACYVTGQILAVDGGYALT